MAPSLLVIGTSNTLRRGGFPAFLSTLRPDLPLRIEGVGATPSVLLPYVVADTNLDGITHVAVDTLVNDASLSAARRAADEPSETMLFETLDWLRAAGVVPILLLMPQTNAAGAVPALRARRLAFAADRGIPAVDGHAIVEAMARESGLDEAALFFDSQHPGWPVALVLAGRLLAAMDATEARATGCPTPPYPYLRLPLPAPAPVERATSLLAERYAPLRPGEAVTLDVGEDATLVGFAMNRARSRGTLTITAEGGTAQDDLGTVAAAGEDAPDAGGRDHVHVVASLPTPLPGRSFRFAMADGEAEIGAAVLRRGAFPPRAALPDHLPGRAPPLPPADAAIAQAAAMAREAAGGHAAARAFRRHFVTTPPLWDRPAPQIARIVAQAGIALGDPGGAGRVLLQATAAFPEVEALQDHLTELARRRRRTRPDPPAGA